MKTYFNKKIQKIICPFDFTETGRAGLEYAGLLSSALSANLTIFYVQPSELSEMHQLYDDLNDNTRGIKRLLRNEIKAMEQLFGIECDYAFEPVPDAVITVGAASVDYDLIVMGTNGADELYEHVFGTSSHHTLGLARCPVLMIPPDCKAQIPRLILYAHDPETNPTFPIGHLESLALPLNAELRCLHVESGQGTAERAKEMQLPGGEPEVKDTDIALGSEPTYPEKVISEVDEYINNCGADMLALSYHHHNLFEKLFQMNVIKQVSRIADYPVLIFWH